MAESMTRSELLAFLRRFKLAVVSTVTSEGASQAAIVGFAVSDELELVFDTSKRSRKLANLRANPRVAVVIGGWDSEQTAQLEGLADEGVDDRLREVYFAAYPDGQDRAKSEDITHVRIRITWAKYSDFGAGPTVVSSDACPAMLGG